MKRFLLAATLLLGATAPAKATGGLTCSTAGANPIQVSLVIGHAVAASVVSARMTEGGRQLPVKVAQSWIDGNEVRIDLTDPDALRHEVRISTRRKGANYDGSLWRHGKRRWVRCSES